MKLNLLTVCPTRNRPDKFKILVDSFHKTTSDDSILIAMIDDDDPQLEEYIEFCEEESVNYFVQPRMSLTEIINSAFNRYPNFAYYCVCNDDMEFITNGWDKFLESDGVAYGNFRCRNGNPMSSVINGDLVRACGWLQYPELISLSGDNIWFWIGKRLDKLYRYMDVFINHNHPYFDKVIWDKTYDESNSNERYAVDWAVVMDWLKYKSNDDINKIKEKLCLI